MNELPPVPFHVPYLVGAEQAAIGEALSAGFLHGDGPYSHLCQNWFKKKFGATSALMTPSCSLALDLAALLVRLAPKDEVLVPDFTFVTTAQCVALRGATPVFCDIRSDTLNLDENRLAEALTPRTRAIIPVHYGGVSAEMDAINAFARKYDLLVIEDAAQAVGCTYRNKPVGSLGDFATFSFHATKNIQCAEGGMLVINNEAYAEDAHIAWEKGTDRRKFLDGQVDKYQWTSLGSSFVSSELNAAMLSVQLEEVESVSTRRISLWQTYHDAFLSEEQRGVIRRPFVPEGCLHNGHLFYLILPDRVSRDGLLRHLKKANVNATFHYVPLHDSVGGRAYGRIGMSLDNAATLPHRLIRLPLFTHMNEGQQNRVIEATKDFLERL